MAIQGVNIGGWFIPENWLTPSLFSSTDAVDLNTLLQTEEGKRRYQAHLDSFITEDDFKWLRDHKVTLVRIPVGYWLFDGDASYPASVKYLDWAMKMAEKYDLHVLIDLHAVKGSQNGQIHSGQIGKIEWQKQRVYQKQTIGVLIQIAERYNSLPSFWGIELVNEPKLGRYYFTLLRFYREAYRQLRKTLRPGVYTVFHDAFHPVLFTGALWPRKHHPIVFDAHWYVIAPQLSGKLSFRAYQRLQCGLFGALLWFLQRWQSVIIGEWSAVLPQEMFNRIPQDRHYELLARNIAAQQKIYRPALATMYWSYKAEGKGMWNFRSLVEAGVLMLK